MFAFLMLLQPTGRVEFILAKGTLECLFAVLEHVPR